MALTGSLSGNTMTYSLTEKTADATTRFTATWTVVLRHGASPGQATVSHSVTITNPTASPLTLSLFHYLDYDLDDNSAGHSATGGLAGMTITNGVTKGTYTPVTGASAFQASAGFPPLDVSLLDDQVTNLNGSGLPMSNDDWTGAYQWDLTIPAGGSATIDFDMAVTPAPEPGAVLALAAAGLGLLGKARRARLTPRG